MISTGSIFVAAVLVFGLMLVGIALTALEFKKMEDGSADEKKSQQDFAKRHTARIVSENNEGLTQG